MSDQGSREIQLSGKQLIFLFMSAIVLLVVVFLLGVMLGRGVNPEVMAGTPTGDEGLTDAITAGPGAPASGDAPVDLSFPSELTGRSGGAQGAAVPPTPPDEMPPIAPPVITESAPPPLSPPAESAEGWVVQVGAFRSRDGANGVVADLTAKGHKAFISTDGGLHRVRVGPFPDRGGAERAAAALQKQGHANGRILKEGQ